MAKKLLLMILLLATFCILYGCGGNPMDGHYTGTTEFDDTIYVDIEGDRICVDYGPAMIGTIDSKGKTITFERSPVVDPDFPNTTPDPSEFEYEDGKLTFSIYGSPIVLTKDQDAKPLPKSLDGSYSALNENEPYVLDISGNDLLFCSGSTGYLAKQSDGKWAEVISGKTLYVEKIYSTLICSHGTVLISWTADEPKPGIESLTGRFVDRGNLSMFHTIEIKDDGSFTAESDFGTMSGTVDTESSRFLFDPAGECDYIIINDKLATGPIKTTEPIDSISCYDVYVAG